MGTLSGFDFTYDIEKQVDEIMEPGILQPQLKKAVKSREPLKVQMNVKEATPTFLKQVEGLGFWMRPTLRKPRMPMWISPIQTLKS